jgi:hypothetical protein
MTSDGVQPSSAESRDSELSYKFNSQAEARSWMFAMQISAAATAFRHFALASCSASATLSMITYVNRLQRLVSRAGSAAPMLSCRDVFRLPK